MALIGVAAATIVGLVCRTRKRRMRVHLSNVADEGYETAYDIVYPKNRTTYRRRLRYGPVF